MCHLFGMLSFNQLSLINHNIYSDPLCLMCLCLFPPTTPDHENIALQRDVNTLSWQKLFSESPNSSGLRFLLQTFPVRVLVSQKHWVTNFIDYFCHINLDLLNQAAVVVLNASRTVAGISSYCAVLHSLSVARFFCFTLVPAGIYVPRLLIGRCTVTVKKMYEMEVIVKCLNKGSEPQMQSQKKLSV